MTSLGLRVFEGRDFEVDLNPQHIKEKKKAETLTSPGLRIKVYEGRDFEVDLNPQDI